MNTDYNNVVPSRGAVCAVVAIRDCVFRLELTFSQFDERRTGVRLRASACPWLRRGCYTVHCTRRSVGRCLLATCEEDGALGVQSCNDSLGALIGLLRLMNLQTTRGHTSESRGRNEFSTESLSLHAYNARPTPATNKVA